MDHKDRPDLKDGVEHTEKVDDPDLPALVPLGIRDIRDPPDHLDPRVPLEKVGIFIKVGFFPFQIMSLYIYVVDRHPTMTYVDPFPISVFIKKNFRYIHSP